MPCYSPLPAYMNSDGEVVWSRKSGVYPLPLPCGKCAGCKKRRSEDWALRCFHESLSYEHNSFLTLTYSDEYYPPNGSLDKTHLQNFMKRLRKRISPRRVRFFACGEYGEQFGRPHYHIVLFNYDFPDRYVWKMSKGNYLYRSDELEELWPFGDSIIGVASMATMRYCIKYSTKAQFDKNKYPNLLPPFIQMSTKPAIGTDYMLKFKHELINNSSVVSNGQTFAVPRAYTKKYSEEEKNKVADDYLNKSNRVRSSMSRLRTIEKVKILNSNSSGEDYDQ